MSIPPFLPVMVRPAQGTSLVAATPVPVCRNTGALPVATLRTFFPAATGLLYNMGHGMQAVPVVTSPDGEVMFLMPDFSLHYVATFASDQRFTSIGNAGDSVPTLENQNSSANIRAAVVEEPQREDVTRTHGNLNCRLVKLEKEVAEDGKKVLELLREKDKFDVLKRKVGEMGQVLEKADGLEEVGRVVKDARELRREVAEVKEMVTHMENAVESASEVSATTKVHMSEIALLKEDTMKQNVNHEAVRAEVLVLKEEMGERISTAAKSKSQVDYLEGEVLQMKGEVNQLKGDIVKLRELVKELSDLKKEDSNGNVLQTNRSSDMEKKAPLQHTNSGVEADSRAEGKKEAKEVEQKNDKTTGLQTGISGNLDKTIIKKGKKGECVDVEEEEEKATIAPLTFVSMKPKLTRKVPQRK